MPLDHDQFRADSRDSWEASAVGWEKRRAEFQASAAPVSAWLVDAIHPQPGHVVLELAAGVGDTGFLAAELIQPGGKLITTDGAEAMVEAAKRRAAELGLSDIVEARPMEAEWIDLDAASVDGVLCRWGYMLLADPEAALRETRRVLRSGGRLALATWGPAEANPWSPGRLLTSLGFAPPPPEGMPGPFTIHDPAVLEELLATAGFEDIEVAPLDFSFTAVDADAWFAQQLDCSPTLRRLARELSPADHTRMRDAFDDAIAQYALPDGTLELPAQALVAAAGA